MLREDFVLAALASSGGELFTPAQIQKLLFLLQKEIPEVGSGHFSFVPYHYGPFDAAVFSTLENLQRAKLVEIPVDTSLRMRSYRTSRSGQKKGDEILGTLKTKDSRNIKKLSAWVRSLSFRQLISAIYQAYPAMKVNSVFRG